MTDDSTEVHKRPEEQPQEDHGFEVIDSWDDPDNSVETSAQVGPLGPNADATFPSLPAGATTRPELREQLSFQDGVATVPLMCNVFALTNAPVRAGGSIVPGDANYPEDFDRPERERIFNIAEDFVEGHVRVLNREFAIKTPNRHLKVGSVLISEDPVPTTLLRHARFQWAINDGKVVELHNVRLPVGHLSFYERPPLQVTDENWPGDDSGLAIFVASLLGLLRVEAPDPLGAVGGINFNTNAVRAVSDIDSVLEQAQSGQLSDLMLPFMNGKSSGMHNQVRYWSVRDTNEAAYSALTHLAGEVVVPNLYRRALTKQAYSWLSLLFALTAILTYALAVSFNSGGDAPKGFLEVVLILTALFFIGSETCTHRYWKRDR